MKPDPDFSTDGPSLMLPEVQMWRAVLFRAVLDAQHGSQAMMRDVLRWIDTKDFERVLVWAGFELEQGRRAAKYLRDVCAERSAQSAKSESLAAAEQPELEDESELRRSAPRPHLYRPRDQPIQEGSVPAAAAPQVLPGRGIPGRLFACTVTDFEFAGCRRRIPGAKDFRL